MNGRGRGQETNCSRDTHTRAHVGAETAVDMCVVRRCKWGVEEDGEDEEEAGTSRRTQDEESESISMGIVVTY